MSTVLLRAALLLLAATVVAQEPPGKTYFWLRVWPDKLVKYDVEKDRVVKTIQNKHGIAYGLQLSHDRKQFFITTDRRRCVEVVDIARMEQVAEHSFEETGKIQRVDRILEVPGGTHWYVRVDCVKAEPDHFVIEKPQWLYYNIAEKKIEKRQEKLPKAIRRGARISPDGKKWHVFGRDITIVDPETLKEEGKIELSRPLYSGMGPISVRGEDFYDNKNPDGYRMFYTMRDPVKKNRSLAGIIDIDIKGQKVAGLKEWGVAPRVWRLRLTRDRKLGIGQKRGRDRRRQSDGDDPRIVFVTYDMENGKKLRETDVEVRNGLGLSAISPDGKKLYLAGRGHELVIFDDQHRYLKTVELEGETDGRIIVLEE